MALPWTSSDMATTADVLPVVSSPTVQAAKGRPIRLGYMLRYDEIPLTCFSDLCAALDALANLNQAYVIRGRKQVEDRLIRRRFKHEPFHLAQQPRQWLCIDFDAVPIADTYADPVGSVTAARAMLPSGLANAECYYAITKSTTDCQLNVHLWFWLDRPHAASEVSGALQGISGVDHSLYKPTQPHFTASPLLDIDPLKGRRRGTLTGDPARIGEPVIVNPTAAWLAIERNCTAIARKPPGERHNAINRAAFHLAEHVASGAVSRDDLEAVLIDTAIVAGLSRERAEDEVKRALDDGIEAANNAPAWLDKLSRAASGAAKSTHANAILALSESPEWAGTLVYNTRDDRPEWAKDPPVKLFASAKAGLAMVDEHAAIALAYIAGHGMALSLSGVKECMLVVARMREFDPLKDRLDSFDWDGTSRLANWTHVYLGTPDNEYTRSVGRKWLISALARLYQPGCKADYCLVLEGVRGIFKSQALDILGLSYTRDIRVDVRSTDALDALHRSTWLAHLPEMEALKKGKDIEATKAFMTAREDHFREKYARITRTFKRSMVFCATTNEEDYLVDATGNRQYWPIYCTLINLVLLEADVEQLWAEAKVCYLDGEKWFLEDINEAQAADEQRERLAVDPWEDELEECLRDINEVSTRECLETHLGIDTERRTPYHAQRVGRALKRLGWEKMRGREKDTGKRGRFYTRIKVK